MSRVGSRGHDRRAASFACSAIPPARTFVTQDLATDPRSVVAQDEPSTHVKPLR